MRKITDEQMNTLASYMKDDIREELHLQISPCSNKEFIRAYLKKDPEFAALLEEEFKIDTDELLV